TMLKVRQLAFCLVRRQVGGNEVHAAEIELLRCGASERQVPEMYRIERSAEQADLHALSALPLLERGSLRGPLPSCWFSGFASDCSLPCSCRLAGRVCSRADFLDLVAKGIHQRRDALSCDRRDFVKRQLLFLCELLELGELIWISDVHLRRHDDHRL